MSKKENAPVITDESASTVETQYSTLNNAGNDNFDNFDDDDNLDDWEDDGFGGYCETAFGKYRDSWLTDTANSFPAVFICGAKELAIEAEAYATKAVCDDMLSLPDPHMVPLEAAARAVGRIMKRIADNLGTTNGRGVRKPAFDVGPRSESTCARLIATREHVVMVYPADSNGNPMDTKGEGALVRYVRGGRNKGIHVEVTAGWVHNLVDRCRGGQASQRFAIAVMKDIADIAVADESLHVVENSQPDLVAFDNGIFDLKEGKLRPFSSSVVRLRKTPITWSDNPEPCGHTKPDGTTYATPADLMRSWVSSDALARLLWQVARASLTNQRLNRMVTLYNEAGANGKSTYIALLRHLVGDIATMSPTIADLADSRFGLGDIVGCRLVAIDDSEGGDYIKRAARLKAIITGGRIQVERKNEQPFYYAPNVVVIGAVNNFVLSRDKSGGWLRRQLLVPFSSTFLGEADPTIDEWIASPQFLTWAAHYALCEVDDFSETDIPIECIELLQEYRRENDSVLDFFDDVIEAVPSQVNPDEKGRYCDFVSISAAYKGYQFWLSETRPNARPVSQREFGRSFREAAAASPNWLVEIDDKNKLKLYRAASFANTCGANDTKGARLFACGREYDADSRRQIERYAYALEQGVGRGIVRAYPNAAPVSPDVLNAVVLNAAPAPDTTPDAACEKAPVADATEQATVGAGTTDAISEKTAETTPTDTAETTLAGGDTAEDTPLAADAPERQTTPDVSEHDLPRPPAPGRHGDIRDATPAIAGERQDDDLTHAQGVCHSDLE